MCYFKNKMEVFKSKLHDGIDKINEKIIEERKILNKFEKQNKTLYEHKFKKSLLFTPSLKKLKNAKNIINPLIKSPHQKHLENTKLKILSKNSLANSKLNTDFDTNKHQNLENNKIKINKDIIDKENKSILDNKLKNIHQRKSIILSSSPMEFRISGKTLTRNSHRTNENNIFSSKLFNSFRIELKSKDKNYIINSKNDNLLNKMSFTERKNSNPFEIQDEDRIFDELNRNNLKQNLIKPRHKKNIKSSIFTKNQILKLNKTKLSINSNKSSLSPEKKILNDVYKFSPEFFEKIRKIRKERKNYNLKNYQINLLNTISDNFSKEAIKKLEKKFINLRNYSYQRIIFNR